MRRTDGTPVCANLYKLKIVTTYYNNNSIKIRSFSGMTGEQTKADRKKTILLNTQTINSKINTFF